MKTEKLMMFVTEVSGLRGIITLSVPCEQCLAACSATLVLKVRVDQFLIWAFRVLLSRKVSCLIYPRSTRVCL